MNQGPDIRLEDYVAKRGRPRDAEMTPEMQLEAFGAVLCDERGVLLTYSPTGHNVKVRRLVGSKKVVVATHCLLEVFRPQWAAYFASRPAVARWEPDRGEEFEPEAEASAETEAAPEEPEVSEPEVSPEEPVVADPVVAEPRRPGRPKGATPAMSSAERVRAWKAKHSTTGVDIPADLAERIRGHREGLGLTTAQLLHAALDALEIARRPDSRVGRDRGREP